MALPPAANGPAPHEAELARLYDQHVDFVWRVTRRRGVASTVAEDIVHEVFLILHKRLAELDTGANIRGWLYRVTLNVVRHHQRSFVRRERAYTRYVDPMASPQRRLDPELEAARAQALAFVDRFLLTLDRDKRRVFELCEIEGMNPGEVAEITEVSVNTVYSRLRAARQRFEAALARERLRERTLCRA